MPRRAAQVTQADIARVIRAAKQAGAAEVVVKIGEQSLIVRLVASENPLQKDLKLRGRSYCDEGYAPPSPAASST
jgi:hypothetical protein